MGGGEMLVFYPLSPLYSVWTQAHRVVSLIIRVGLTILLKPPRKSFTATTDGLCGRRL